MDGLTNLYAAILDEADKALKREHEWLSAHVERIARIMAGKSSDPEFLEEVQRRYRSWADERAWFTRCVGTVTFEEVCTHVGADVDDARAARAKYFALPFSGALLRIRCESAQSKMLSDVKAAAEASGS